MGYKTVKEEIELQQMMEDLQDGCKRRQDEINCLLNKIDLLESEKGSAESKNDTLIRIIENLSKDRS